MDYWKECISESFDDVGIVATEEQIKTVASWVEGAHENYGMAFGHDCISNPKNPKNTEIENIKKEHKEEIKRLEDQIHTYRKSVSTRRKVPLEDVCIEDGDVIYGRSLGGHC